MPVCKKRKLNLRKSVVALSKDVGTDSRSPVIDRGVKGGTSALAGRGKVNESHSVDSLTATWKILCKIKYNMILT
jgi:hypothetical protein